MSDFAYKAIQLNGKVRSGRMTAASEAEVFSKLRAENLSPVSIVVKHGAKDGSGLRLPAWLGRKPGLSGTDLEEFLRNLAVLLRAGADIRTALGVVGSDSHPQIRDVSQKILGGASLDAALGHVIPPGLTHLRGLIAAGEARGDVASGLDGAAQVLTTRRKIRQQLFEALSYPVFVFATALAALSIILLVVVPAIAPLLSDTGRDPPVYFAIIVFLSEGLQNGWPYTLGGFAAAGLAAAFGWRYGGLKAWLEVWLLDGPLGNITRPLIFGGYARTLGDSLSAGASLSEALRLCSRSLGNAEARKRMDVVGTHIRQGRALSEAFRQVKGFPKAVIKLTEVGEASSALGPMLARAGEREETAALVRIDKTAKLLGPLLIVALGAMIGGLMAGVLTALTDIGSVAGT
ncbi:bacterial type II secretion system protein F domain protein [Asticcacaulis biprosthecium C19]|uniref:Bacterial type II secretion system protein F domain protein n=1 Tax=Asticcacaulis biprosthecium C19 TaxID=715226 RepID=F4QHZ8_9CAUL|nr:type II secretion system F family protein [Asticcacaulis biprosthecium]EGF92865.1 bacterial type II secretion system protein F domain protein [Asticcacaulis biprosthecium C19]